MTDSRLLYAAVALCAAVAARAAPTPPSSRALDALPLHMISADAASRAVEAFRARHTASLPFAFAAAVDEPLSLADGQWSQEGEHAVWRTRVSSVGARSLSLMFDRARLPAGAELYLYDPDAREVQGPLTAAQVSEEGELYTPLVHGEQVIVELRVAAAQRDAVELHLARVYHGYADVLKDGVIARAGSCEISVACPQGDNYRDQIRAVALLEIRLQEGAVLCSGSLINNVRQDRTPYLLTANHCEITSSNDSGVVTYWNYESSSCGGSGGGQIAMTMVGSTLIDHDEASDYALIRLAQTPPPDYDVYYAGFDASGDAPQQGAAIHHPGGDWKSISLYDSPATRADARFEETDIVVHAWEVHWSQGVTEPGSSGAGLLNEDKRIVGVLSGGISNCSPAGQDDPDYFGRLDSAWSAGLNDYLDPDHRGVNTLSGLDAKASGSAPPPEEDSDDDDDDDGDGGGGAFGMPTVAALAVAAALRRRGSRAQRAARRR